MHYDRGCDRENAPDCFPFRCSHLCLGPIQDFLEFADTMPHAGVHVRLGAFDVIVKVVAEALNVADS